MPGFGFSTMRVMRDTLSAASAPAVSTMPQLPMSSAGTSITPMVDTFSRVATSTICFVTGNVGVDEVIGEDHRERLVADDGRRAQHGVAEAERLGLPDVDAVDARRRGIFHRFQELALVSQRELGLELVGLVEVILDRALVAPGDEDHVRDAGRRGLLDRVLDERLVDDGEHFLGTRLGGGQEPAAESGNGEDGFGDFFHELVRAMSCWSPASSSTATPSSSALASLLPASAPATT